MIGVPGAVLAQMRAAAEGLMTDSCTIEKLSNARGPAGERVNTWVTVSTGTECRLITYAARNSGTMIAVAGQSVLPERYRIALPHGTTIAAQHRITLTSDSSVWLVENIEASQTDVVSMIVVVVPETP